MRAKELIAEEKAANIPDAYIPAMSDLAVVDGVDQYYGLYRMMIVAAGQPHLATPTKSVLGHIPVAMPYTEQDKEKLIQSAKEMGGKFRSITGNGSEDPHDNHVMSPVPHNSGKHIRRK